MLNRYKLTVNWLNNKLENKAYIRVLLNDGQKVTFNIGANQKGEHTTNIETL